MSVQEIEALRVGLILGVVCGLTFGALVTYILIRGKKPPAPSHASFFQSRVIR